MSSGRVSIIIPTTCEAKRRESLLHAIASVSTGAAEPPAIILVVNGERYDPVLLAELRKDTRLRVVYERVGSLPRALRIGRDAISTEYFGFLDDDDEYLPGAVAVRQDYLDAHPDADVVVCNGLRSRDGHDQAFMTDFASLNGRALQAMAESNWLASCGALYRTARVAPDFFDERFKYLEWTLLGYKLATTRQVAFVDATTFRINETPGSLSRSEAYEISQASVLEEILKLALPVDVRRRIQCKLGAAHHTLSDHYRLRGRWAAAWRHHLISLALPGRINHLSYTRRLFWVKPNGAVP